MGIPDPAAASGSPCNPLLIEVGRGAVTESVHRGAAAVARADGSLIAAWGDVDRPVFPRSAIKPFQALPLLETGAADRFAVTDEELALACGSHGGEDGHVERVAAWLARLGLGPRDLVCGAHPPLSEAAARALVQSGEKPSSLHNNCSGKHAGFLATALFLKEPVVGYAGPVHPVQLRVKRVLAQITGVAAAQLTAATDGCNAPIYPVPVRGLALAWARLADPESCGRLRCESLRRVAQAMTRHPALVGDDARFDTRVMAAAAGAVIVKGGAEGVHAAALPAAGLGIAVKVDDGAKRAAEAAMAALLVAFGGLDAGVASLLASYRETPVRSASGLRVGVLRPAAGWPTAVSRPAPAGPPSGEG
jgi:L-asparaginase II